MSLSLLSRSFRLDSFAVSIVVGLVSYALMSMSKKLPNFANNSETLITSLITSISVYCYWVNRPDALKEKLKKAGIWTFSCEISGLHHRHHHHSSTPKIDSAVEQFSNKISDEKAPFIWNKMILVYLQTEKGGSHTAMELDARNFHWEDPDTIQKSEDRFYIIHERGNVKVLTPEGHVKLLSVSYEEHGPKLYSRLSSLGHQIMLNNGEFTFVKDDKTFVLSVPGFSDRIYDLQVSSANRFSMSGKDLLDHHKASDVLVTFADGYLAKGDEYIHLLPRQEGQIVTEWELTQLAGRSKLTRAHPTDSMLWVAETDGISEILVRHSGNRKFYYLFLIVESIIGRKLTKEECNAPGSHDDPIRGFGPIKLKQGFIKLNLEDPEKLSPAQYVEAEAEATKFRDLWHGLVYRAWNDQSKGFQLLVRRNEEFVLVSIPVWTYSMLSFK